MSGKASAKRKPTGPAKGSLSGPLLTRLRASFEMNEVDRARFNAIAHSDLSQLALSHELKAKDDTVVVSWLPQYHDMGLIGSYLGVLYCGGSGFYMSPLSFLDFPHAWSS